MMKMMILGNQGIDKMLEKPSLECVVRKLGRAATYRSIYYLLSRTQPRSGSLRPRISYPASWLSRCSFKSDNAGKTATKQMSIMYPFPQCFSWLAEMQLKP